MKASELLYLSRTVRNLEQSAAFHTQALGFTQVSAATDADPALAALLGGGPLRLMHLERGSQTLELACFASPGLSYPADSHSNDCWFQHCALVTDDIERDHARLCRFTFSAITVGGPQRLPGGIVAFKFRDGDGHPLELIQFPIENPMTAQGIDHIAIAVDDTQRAIAYYEKELGLVVQARQTNAGPAQNALDGLVDVKVDVVGLAPDKPAPHLELLGYQSPRGRPRLTLHPSDNAASRVVFWVDHCLKGLGTAVLKDGRGAMLQRDPAGHMLLLLEKPR